MPYWGRPSGARKGRKMSRREWEEQQQRQWEEQQRRFEDLDSDSDTGRGVELDPAFVSDKLYFDGADLGRSHGRRRYSVTPSSSDSDDYEEEQDPRTAHMQIALRDKEDVLVHQAHRRIDKARMLGQSNVKLPKLEAEALEKAERKAVSKRKPVSSRWMPGRSPRASGPPSPTASRKASKSSFTKIGGSASPVQPANPPGFKVTGPQGEAIYSPLGYYPPNLGPSQGGNPRLLSRPSSSRGLQQQRTPPLPQSAFRVDSRRNFSGPEHYEYTRPLPDDPDWRPRNRSDSRLPYPVDPFQYQTSGPGSSRDSHNQGRRHVSGPADTYGSHRPNTLYPSSSDPPMTQRRYHAGYEDDESDDDDDDDDSGVLVNVIPHSHDYDAHHSGRDSGSLRSRRSRR